MDEAEAPAAAPAVAPAPEVSEETPAPGPAPATPRTDRTQILLQSSLVLLTHPDVIAKMETVAGGKRKLQSIQTPDGTALWEAGQGQLAEGRDVLELNQYVLVFDESVPLGAFMADIQNSTYKPSFMHVRRPGYPIGTNYKYLDQQELSAARIEAEEKKREPVEYMKETPYEIPIDQMTDISNILDPELKVLDANIQRSADGGFSYATFGIVTRDGAYKFYKVEAKDAQGVLEKLQTFIRNPDI